jgi:hypothetical protein
MTGARVIATIMRLTVVYPMRLKYFLGEPPPDKTVRMWKAIGRLKAWHYAAYRHEYI